MFKWWILKYCNGGLFLDNCSFIFCNGFHKDSLLTNFCIQNKWLVEWVRFKPPKSMSRLLLWGWKRTHKTKPHYNEKLLVWFIGVVGWFGAKVSITPTESTYTPSKGCVRSERPNFHYHSAQGKVSKWYPRTYSFCFWRNNKLLMAVITRGLLLFVFGLGLK